MANQLIDDLKNSTDIVDIVQRYVPLKKAGSNYAGNCPFHKEKTASFIVSPTKQIFKCFGCGKAGSVITFIQEIERIDFWDAVKELAKIQNFDITKYDTNTQKYAANNDEKGKIKRMHSLAQNFFKEQLANNQEAQTYLKEKRKLSNNLIEQFGIGYAPEKYLELVQLLRTKGFTDQDILDASLAKKNDNGEIYSFFRKRITFPIFDIMGNIIGFSARVINPEDKPKYLNSAEHKAFEKSKVLYGLNFAKNNIREHNKIIIVEGQMDVLGLAKLGIPVGVATSGTALTDEHVKILKRYTENLYLMFDNDLAGQQATQRALKLFYHQNLFPKIISLPEPWKDVDEISNEENGKEIFNECLSKAEDGFVELYNRLRKSSDMTSPVDKQKLINTLFDVILSVNSLTIQEHYKDILAKKLGFAFEIIDTQFKRYKSTDGRIQLLQNQRIQEKEQSEKYKLEREWLYAAILYNNLIEKYLKESEDSSKDYEKFKNFTEFSKALAHASPDSLISKIFQNNLTEEEKTKIDELTLRRDKEIEIFDENTVRYQHIIKTLLPVIQKELQIALKSSKISAEEKSQLLIMRKSL